MSRHAPDQCDVCDVWPIETTPATVVDHSGGSFVYVCSGCREALTRDRCRSCGRTLAAHRARKSAGLQFHPDGDAGGDGETPPVLPLCDDCREALLTDASRPTGAPDTVGADGAGHPGVDKGACGEVSSDMTVKGAIASDGLGRDSRS